MKTWVRLCLASGLALMSVGLLSVSLWAPASSAAALSFTDPLLDTMEDGNGTTITAPRADIVAASGELRPEGIALSVRVQEPADPAADSNWRRPTTYVSWMLDTNADTIFDYEIRYQAQRGALTGEVGRVGVPESSRQVCGVSSVGFSPDTGYSVVVDPNCVGNPVSFSYRITVYYATDQIAAVDIAPDRRPSLVATAAPAAPPSSAPAASAPAPAPAAAPAPTQAAPAPAPAPRVSTAPAPAPARAPAPATAPPRPSSPAPAAARPVPAPAPAPAPVAASVPAPSPPTGLAQTGPRATQLLCLGAALVLGGLSLMVATGRLSPAYR